MSARISLPVHYDSASAESRRPPWTPSSEAGLRPLRILDARIDERARATRAEHPWWPCAEGCDRCCRSLPRLPTITAAEWERLKSALAALPLDVQSEVRRLAVAESTKTSGPITCPMLDRSRGACLVYAARPIACRTYGFYTERDAGLHCSDVTRAVETHGASVVWGNGEGVASDMEAFGRTASLAEWMSLDEALPR